jgi:hypothetical protein
MRLISWIRPRGSETFKAAEKLQTGQNITVTFCAMAQIVQNRKSSCLLCTYLPQLLRAN